MSRNTIGNNKLSSRSKTTKEDQETYAPKGASTPTQKKSHLQLDKDYSPVFLPCTQESLDNVDVLWDWNSPQSKSSYSRKREKRLHNAQSPKLPIKKLPVSTHSKMFEQLKNDLKAFQEEIKVPSNTFNDKHLLDNKDLLYDKNSNELDDLFNDSMENEFILVSQRIEEEFYKNSEAKSTKSSPRNLFFKSFSSNALLEANTSNKINDSISATITSNLKSENVFNDSIDLAMQCINDDDVKQLVSKEECKPALKFKTKSLSFGHQYNKIDENAKNLADAIEKKRLQALSLLRSKNKNLSDSDTSPIKCSPEEIEMKRKQALAKLEAKKKHEIIERNRQEALKRLEANRKKRLAFINQ